MNLAFRTALMSGTRIVTAFTPLSLFASGEVGAWYDPSDMSTMFQDAAGTTPVTAVEQPVSLIFDKSKSLALGSELVTNGTFDTDSSWSKGTGWSISGGEAVLSSTAVNQQISQSISFVAGKTYQVTFTVKSVPTNNGRITVSDSVSFTYSTPANSSGTYTVLFVAATGSNLIGFRNSNAAVTQTAIDNISVKEIAGNHAYTPSTATASRPVLSARYNLLTKTEQFNDAAWTKTRASILSDTATAPNGTQTADFLREDTSAFDHNAAQTITVSASTSYTISAYIKADTRTWAFINFLHPTVSDARTFFNLSNGTVGTNPAGTVATVESVGSGWYRCSVTRTTASNQTSIGVTFGLATADNTFLYTGDGTSGIYIWGADLRVANDGVALPVYQRVNTSTDYDTTNFPMYLRFDGSDDYMLTGTITPGTDKAQVFAGVRKLSDAAAAIVLELSTTSGTQNGSLAVTAPNSVAANLGYRTRGTAVSQAQTSASYASPYSTVISCVSEIATDTATIRVNGVQDGSATTDQGTGNYLAYPLYIGRRGGTIAPFNGRLYGAIIRFGANLTDTQITNTETWMNGKTKAY